MHGLVNVQTAMHVACPMGRVAEHRKRETSNLHSTLHNPHSSVHAPRSGQGHLHVHGVLGGLWLFPLEVLADDICQRLSRGLDERGPDAEHVEEHEQRAELAEGGVQRDWLGGEGRREGFDAEGLVDVSDVLQRSREW